MTRMTEYETTVVVRPDIGGDAVEATLDRVREAVKSRGGKLLALNHWGKKKLAFPIAKHSRGIYVHAQYLGLGDLVAEIERNLRNSENVLRFLTIKVATNVDPATREEKSYVAPSYDIEEPAAEEAEAAPEAVEAAEPAEESLATHEVEEEPSEGDTHDESTDVGESKEE